MAQHERLVIVGSGPAGYTAALYAARANLNPLLFEGLQPGGQLTITSDVENYPGLPGGHPRARAHGADEEAGGAVRHAVRAGRGDARRPLEAAVPALAGRPALHRRRGDRSRPARRRSGSTSRPRSSTRGAASRPARPATGSSSAASTSPWWAAATPRWRRRSSSRSTRRRSTSIHRRDELRASKIMQDRARKNPKIEFVLDSVVDEILGDGKAVTGVRLKLSAKDGATRELPLKGVFMGIGHEPNTRHLPGPARHERRRLSHREGALHRDERAGRVRRGRRRPTRPTARRSAPPGSGCMAAIDAERFLGEHATETWD